MREVLKLLPELVKELDNDEARAAIVFAAWKRAAGSILAKRTVPVEFKLKRFVIGVSDENWRRHLEDLSGQLLFRLNSVLENGTVKFIEFRVVEMILQPEQESIGNTTPDLYPVAAAPGSDKIREAAEAISDVELRNNFIKAAIVCMTVNRKTPN